jgi:transketolase
MRNVFSKKMSELANKDKNIHIVVADISPAGAMLEFQKKNPNRFLNVGVAEQTMIGVCAGLAMKNKKPFAYTISTFALYRPFEMIRNDLCYQNLPVTVVGMGAGTIYSVLGATHLTQEDIAIARAIPNFQVLSPCDPMELEECIEFCVKKSKAPTYLRIGKSGEKNYTINADKWKFGKIRQITKGNKICILSYGPIVEKAFKVNKKLPKNKKLSIYSCHTLKPFDENGLKKIFKKYKTIITLEDHSKIGGLKDIVLSLSHKYNYKENIKSFALQDKFFHIYGSHDDLLNAHGISSEKIYNFVKKIL